MLNKVTNVLGLNTRRVVLSTNDNGIKDLHSVLTRINNSKTFEGNTNSMLRLRAMFGEQLHLAYRDWKAFCHKWQVTVYCNGCLNSTRTYRVAVLNRDTSHDLRFDFTV